MGADEALKSPAERRRKQRKLAKEKAKAKMGLLDSFRFLSKSKYLGFVGLIVLSYGLSMEFTEIVWKVRFLFGVVVRTCVGKVESECLFVCFVRACVLLCVAVCRCVCVLCGLTSVDVSVGLSELTEWPVARNVLVLPGRVPRD